jgi:ergothioneine biosynthesis protein EgtB
MPYAQKRSPSGYRPRVEGAVPRTSWIEIGAGRATLGIDRTEAAYTWDNESPRHSQEVPAFAIESGNVTNAAFMDFVDAGGYREPRFWRPADWDWARREDLKHPPFWERREGGWTWRGLFESIPLPSAWPVYVSHAEAEAYARFCSARLPTEAEFQRAAYGVPGGEERLFPWGGASPDSGRHGVFDFASWDPSPAGSHPAGRSAWGVDDLVGNGWEWTSTPFAPFPGFRPQATYPEYSADFFDGDHFVMKGASSATARELLRPTFRNWFRPHYPYVYATFRCARDHA